ncbi:MAG: hypothetical protein ACXAC7_04595 [Candidatus Hodarchaeales archaeon]
MTLSLNPFIHMTLVEGFFLIIGITSPTWLALFYNLKHRLAKDVVRVTLGIGWGIAVAEVILRPVWNDKIIILLCISISYLIFRKLKHRQTHKNPVQVCLNCQAFNEQVCQGTQNLNVAERQYSRELSDYLQKHLKWEDLQSDLHDRTQIDN